MQHGQNININAREQSSLPEMTRKAGEEDSGVRAKATIYLG